MDCLPDIALTAVVVASLPVCFRWPWIGVLVWCWLGFMNPHRWLHGFAADLHFSKLVGLATLAGLPFTTERYRLPRTREVALLLVFWGITLLSTLFTAIHPSAARASFVAVSKVWLMNVVVVTLLFQERRKIIALVWVLVVSLCVYSVGGAAWALTSGAGQLLYGPPDSQIYDNNALAGALVLLFPLLAFLHRQVAGRWLRGLLALVFAANVLALGATYSRAGFLGGLVVAAGLAWARHYRLLVVAAITVVLIYSVHAIPQEWGTRMATLTVRETAHTDSSAVTRINAWYVAWKLGTDHLLLGAGFVPFAPDVYEQYIPGYSDYHVAHNLFLEVFAEHGLSGLLAYGLLLTCTLLTLRRSAARSRDVPEHQWIANLATAVAVAMAGYLTTALFHPFSYADLLFQCIAIAILLDVLARRAQQPAAPLLPGRLRAWLPAARPLGRGEAHARH